MKRKLVNVVSGVMLSLSFVIACVTGVHAKLGDNPTYGKDLNNYKYSEYGSYARYDCYPEYTQVTCRAPGYYGNYKVAYYVTYTKRGGNYKQFEKEKKGTISQPCYTTFTKKDSTIKRRYHSGYIKVSSDKNSSTAERYCKTIYSN